MDCTVHGVRMSDFHFHFQCWQMLQKVVGWCRLLHAYDFIHYFFAFVGRHWFTVARSTMFSSITSYLLQRVMLEKSFSIVGFKFPNL